MSWAILLCRVIKRVPPQCNRMGNVIRPPDVTKKRGIFLGLDNFITVLIFTKSLKEAVESADRTFTKAYKRLGELSRPGEDDLHSFPVSIWAPDNQTTFKLGRQGWWSRVDSEPIVMSLLYESNILDAH